MRTEQEDVIGTVKTPKQASDDAVATHKEAKKTTRKRTRSKPHPSPQTAKLIRDLEGLHGEAQQHADNIAASIKELKKGAK